MFCHNQTTKSTDHIVEKVDISSVLNHNMVSYELSCEVVGRLDTWLLAWSTLNYKVNQLKSLILYHKFLQWLLQNMALVLLNVRFMM